MTKEKYLKVINEQINHIDHQVARAKVCFFVQFHWPLLVPTECGQPYYHHFVCPIPHHFF